MYSKSRPAKRKRATLKSDVPRDNRMGWRRLSVRGSVRASPPTTGPFQDNQSYPLPGKLRGFGGRTPEIKRTPLLTRTVPTPRPPFPTPRQPRGSGTATEADNAAAALHAGMTFSLSS